jgi:hypothetical protein
MALDIRNRHEQQCPVCEQPLADGGRVAEAQEVLFTGAAGYAWCPECGRQVVGPWNAEYMARWTEAFKRVCRELARRRGSSQLLWRVTKGADTVVELLLAVAEPYYVLHYRQNGDELTVERFASHESAALRSSELLRNLLAQGFVRANLPSFVKPVI